MGTVSRRQVLLGASALVGSALLPGAKSLSAATGEITRPDYLIRAGTNENPWGPSRVALQAVANAIKFSNQYSADRRPLTKLLAKLNDVAPEQVVIGTGSGEILRTAGLLTVMQDGSVVCADPTYHDLVRYAERSGSEIIRVPVDENMNTDLDAMHRAIRADTKCVYIVNPNNPIPSIIDKDELRDFVVDVARDRLVVVDEAYYEFVDDPRYATMMDLVRNGQENLLVARTASKIHGLAGMRIGFGFGHPDLIARISNAKTSAINVLSLHAAFASYQDDEFQEFTIRKNKESLEIIEAMHRDLGHRYVKSHANFSFFETGHDIQQVREAFLNEGVIVGRPFPPMMNWLRISMAKPQEMEYVVQTYKKLYA